MATAIFLPTTTNTNEVVLNYFVNFLMPIWVAHAHTHAHTHALLLLPTSDWQQLSPIIQTS